MRERGLLRGDSPAPESFPDPTVISPGFQIHLYTLLFTFTYRPAIGDLRIYKRLQGYTGL